MVFDYEVGWRAYAAYPSKCSRILFTVRCMDIIVEMTYLAGDAAAVGGSALPWLRRLSPSLFCRCVYGDVCTFCKGL